MKATRKTITTIILELNEQEADWLASLVQNPIGVSPENEFPEDIQMRSKIWNALIKKEA